MSKQIERIVIVGGGTSGWLTALTMQSQLNANPAERRVEITLIESPNVPTIGVGEATLITLPATLLLLDINEREFFQRCNASFKLAVRFADWFTDATGQRAIFYHPFNNPPNCSAYLPAYHYHKLGPPQPGMSLADSVVPNIALLKANKGPRRIGAHDYDYNISYAYHLDAALFAGLLRDVAVERGIKLIRDNVVDVEQDERGYITSLRLEKHENQDVDLVIDCTGFRGVVHSKVSQSHLIDFSNALLNDRAIPVQIPHRDPKKIEPCTRATALSAGWVWRVPLYSRLGTGYVYSSAFKSDDEAREEFLTHLRSIGDLPQDAPDPETRVIKMNVGYHQDSWVKNCVAIGLAGGFVEPLEATAIHSIAISARWLLMNFPDKDFHPPLVQQYNALVSNLYETIRDFVQTHYLSGNRFEPYWRAARSDVKVSDVLKWRMEIWKDRFPDEFDTRGDSVFQYWSYIYILEPRGFFRGKKFALDPAINEADWGIYSRALERKKQECLATLPDHYELLTALRGSAPIRTSAAEALAPTA
jgi:2-polyprenyl-6-methoxyphenol hydroxylase-like FAD-dependent oxidoreductase